MKQTKIIKALLVVAVAGMMSVSCNDWLDVKPKAQEEAAKIFETEDGFKEVLAGCYTTMSKREAYGKELTYGSVGVLGHEWKSGAGVGSSGSFYYNIMRYNYDQAMDSLDNIWGTLYNAIAQVNTLLNYTETNRSVLSDLNYAVIRGEAFALRALLHSDIFRLYSNVTGMQPSADELALPYITSTQPGVAEQLSNQRFYQYIMSDIDSALELLSSDPIYTSAELAQSSAAYYANRNFHLNYYAVVGLRARMCLFWGDKAGALTAAREVIGAQQQKGLFRWVTQDEVTAQNINARERLFSSEHLFALNVTRLDDLIKGYFTESESGSRDPLLTRIPPFAGEDGVDPLFAQGDFRGRFFETSGGVPNVPTKFWQMEPWVASGYQTPPTSRMPVLRISEMYYIAAECLMGQDNEQALQMLNTVRENRGINKLTLPAGSPEVFIKTELQKEYEREFLGEGQLFFYHKRQNTEYISSTGKADYVIPMPASELDLGNRTPVNKK